MKILLTAIGKRVELIKHLKTQAYVIGADCSELNPAREFVDKFILIPRVSDPDYVKALLKICEEEKVDYLIPLLEDEFPVLSSVSDKFAGVGTNLLLSDSKVIDICKDKVKTARFFDKYNIPAPKTYYDIKNGEFNLEYPLIVKPSKGMGSSGVLVVNDSADLEYALRRTEEPVVQEMLKGKEFTMDIFCDNNGAIIYIVPRERLEVRSGEVVKSRVVLSDCVIKLSELVMQSLSLEGSVKGPFTLQCFVNDKNEARMIEINPRFGGGVPLAFASGADYASALKDMLEGKEIKKNEIIPKTMLRYDDSVFI